MAMPLNDWVKSIKALRRFAETNPEKMQTEVFLRDPYRASFIDPNYFYSPADGTILYQKVLTPTQKLAEIKGINYSLQDMLEDTNFDKKCLVIGIFMTYYDVHINRSPYGGYLNYKLLNPVTSYNRPMVFAEKDIVDKDLTKLYKDLTYLKTNARMHNTFYNPTMDYKFHVIQIADYEINVIAHFNPHQNHWFAQNERFSLVRWGSQVELILPLDDRFRFKPVHPDLYHVEGCVDKLVEIRKK